MRIESTAAVGLAVLGCLSGAEPEPDRHHLRRKLMTSESNVDATGYIIGGQPVTDPNKYKYVVSLRKWESHFCGGALIAPDLVISAAHCENIDGARIGGLDKNSEDQPTFGSLTKKTQSTQCTPATRSVDKHIHPDFEVNYVNDIMIVKLPEQMDQDLFPPIKVNRFKTTPQNGDSLHVVGWGQTVANGGDSTMTDILQEAEIKAVPQQVCKQMFGNYLHDDMMCAWDPGQDSCQGDSGGPLVFDNFGTDVIVGVVSWGFGCASSTHPGVYSRLSANYDWIRDKVCCLSEDPPSNFVCNTTERPPTPSPPTPSPPTPPPPTPSPPTPPPPTQPPPTPSPPTPSPSSAPPYVRTSDEISICLTFDRYPMDISCWLGDIEGTEIFEFLGNFDNEMYQFATYNKTVTIPEGTNEVVFTISDAFGDGFAMNTDSRNRLHEKGSYRLVYGDDCNSSVEAAIGGSEFKFVEKKYIQMPGSRCEGESCISILMDFDSYPEDIQYSVACGNSTLRELEGYYGAVDGEGNKLQNATEIIPIPEHIDGNCTVTIHDKHADGICCDNGRGKVDVYLGTVEAGNRVGGTELDVPFRFRDLVVNIVRTGTSGDHETKGEEQETKGEEQENEDIER